MGAAPEVNNRVPLPSAVGNRRIRYSSTRSPSARARTTLALPATITSRSRICSYTVAEGSWSTTCELDQALTSVTVREKTSLGMRFMDVENSSVRLGQIWENRSQVRRPSSNTPESSTGPRRNLSPATASGPWRKALQGVQHMAPVLADVGGHGRLSVGRDRDDPPVGPPDCEDPDHELPVGRGTDIPVPHRGHLEDHVVGQHADQAIDVGSAEGGQVALHDLVFSPVRILKGFGVEARLIEGGPGPLQGAIHGRNAGVEGLGNLARREAEHIAQDQSRALLGGEKLQRGDEGQAHAGALHGNGFGIGRWSAQQAVGKGL